MSESEILDTGLPISRMSGIHVAGPTSLAVNWAEGPRAGRTDIVDLAPALARYKIYRPLRENAELFASAHLIDDGDAIAWGADGLDMSAELIESLAEETRTADEFSRFLRRNQLTQEAAAALLGRSRRQIGYYLKRGPVPRVVALACIGYEALSARRKADAA